MREELTSASLRSSPPIAATLAGSVFGLTLNDWVAVATLVYIALQAFFLLRKELCNRKKRNNKGGD